MVEFKDIEAAAERLAPVVVETPLLQSAALDEAAGGAVHIKPENLQVTGHACAAGKRRPRRTH